MAVGETEKNRTQNTVSFSQVVVSFFYYSLKVDGFELSLLIFDFFSKVARVNYQDARSQIEVQLHSHSSTSFTAKNILRQQTIYILVFSLFFFFHNHESFPFGDSSSKNNYSMRAYIIFFSLLEVFVRGFILFNIHGIE